MLFSRLFVPAYIDPGTGSYMLQLVIGAAVGGLYLVKVYWQRIRACFGGRSDKSGDGPNSD